MITLSKMRVNYNLNGYHSENHVSSKANTYF